MFGKAQQTRELHKCCTNKNNPRSITFEVVRENIVFCVFQTNLKLIKALFFGGMEVGKNGYTIIYTTWGMRDVENKIFCVRL